MIYDNIDYNGDILSLMQRWAPVVYFHPNEKYFPSSVEFFLERVQLKDERITGTKKYYPPITNQILRSYSDGTKNLNKDFYFDIPDLDEKSELLIKQGDPIIKNGQNLICNSPAYCNFLRIDSNFCDLQYWMFYPYDDPEGMIDSALGAHEGDWEHVSVRLNWPESHPEERNQIDPMHQSAFYAIYGSAHSGEGQWNTSPQWVSCADDTNHPAMFAAQGTHANYSTLGDNGTIDREFSDDFVGDTGAYWTTSDNIVPIAWSADLPDNLAWLGFNGRWGATRDKIGVSSPSGPAMKSQFTKGDPSKPAIVPKQE